MPSRFEPPDGKILHGAGQDPQGLAQYVAVLPPELAPAITMAYTAVHPYLTTFRQWRGHTRDEIRRQMELYPRSALQLGLSMCISDDRKVDVYHYEAAVADGQMDAHVEELADLFRSHTAPVFVRPGFEFNGHWNPYEPKAYVRAFRRIVDIFRRRGADNTVFVWHAVTAPPGTPNWRDWYPGSDVVDWWGLSLFPPSQWIKHAGPYLDELAKDAKPLMICESSPMQLDIAAPGAWEAWYEPYFRWVRQTQAVKAFCYINQDFTQFPQWNMWGDTRLHRAPEVLPRFIEELRNPRYLHAGWWSRALG